MKPFRILQGAALPTLRTLPDRSVHCCVTSPPYWGLRSYLPADHADKAEEIGSERTPEEFVARLVEVFREVRRVLRDDGTLWLNLGDSYASIGRTDQKASPKGTEGQDRGRVQRTVEWGKDRHDSFKWTLPGGIKPKDLVGIPWMVAFALRTDGWYLRSDIIWHKPNPMPESVTDRPTKAHEYLFLLTKSERYFYDHEAVKEAAVGQNHHDLTGQGYKAPGQPVNTGNRKALRSDIESRHRSSVPGGQSLMAEPDGKRNRRSVWTVTTAPYADAHFATFPPALVEPCIKAGTSERGVCPSRGAPWERATETERRGATLANPAKLDQIATQGALSGGTEARQLGPKIERISRTVGWRPTCDCIKRRAPSRGVTGDELELIADAAARDICPVPATVLDPFSGAGTVALVATRLQRHAIGIELSADYVAMSERRIVGDAPLFNLGTP